jgi:hypothetical protein
MGLPYASASLLTILCVLDKYTTKCRIMRGNFNHSLSQRAQEIQKRRRVYCHSVAGLIPQIGDDYKTCKSINAVVQFAPVH